MDPTTSMYVAQGIHGIAYGMILFLIASGLNIIFGMMGILNLAHASFFMLSGYLCYQVLVITGNFWAALLLAPIITSVVRRDLGAGIFAEGSRIWSFGGVDFDDGDRPGCFGGGEDFLGYGEFTDPGAARIGRDGECRRPGVSDIPVVRDRDGGGGFGIHAVAFVPDAIGEDCARGGF